MNKRELKRPETVEVEAIGSLHLAGRCQSGVESARSRSLLKGPSRVGVAASLRPAKTQDRFCPRHTPRRARASASLGGLSSRTRPEASCDYIFLPTRLETRTKESNKYAIMLVFLKPNMSNESKWCQPQGAASASCDPLEKRTGYEHIC